MGIQLTQDEYAQFKSSEVGAKILRQLSEIRMGICESMGAGGCIKDNPMDTALGYATNVGQIQGIDWLLIPDVTEDDDEA